MKCEETFEEMNNRIRKEMREEHVEHAPIGGTAADAMRDANRRQFEEQPPRSMTEATLREFTGPMNPEQQAALNKLMPPPETDASGSVSDIDSANAAGALFDPTVTRIATLLTTLIALSGNGDFALWASLGGLDTALRGLDWASAPRPNVKKFFSMVERALSDYSTKIAEHSTALFLLREDAPLPPVPTWDLHDILRVYDAVDALFPKESPRAK